MAYGNKGQIWMVGGIIYVLGMFLIFYFYQFQGVVNPGYIAFMSIGGAFLCMGQMFLGVFDEKGAKNPVEMSSE
ncbi:MAG: hypothetical protein JRN52_12790 [Nitrososphaerota archaeon]|nr:hypothetical protein [Nitrososphaerota archaeon]